MHATAIATGLVSYNIEPQNYLLSAFRLVHTQAVPHQRNWLPTAYGHRSGHHDHFDLIFPSEKNHFKYI